LYLIYVDDCGKPERIHRHNKYFCLSAVIVNECDWDEVNEVIKETKQSLKIKEIHTRNIYRREKEFQYLNQNPVFSCRIMENIFNIISKLNITLISSVTDKERYFGIRQDDNVENKGWMHLLERCDMEVSNRRRRSGSNYDKGLRITDHHSSDKHDERIKNIIFESGSTF